MVKTKISSDWLKKYSFQLKVTDPDEPIDDLKPLATLIGSAKIVGMGEATHGSREFTLIRHRILRFLVEQMGFSGLILETPQQPAKLIDGYIKTGAGNAKKLLNDLGYWVHNTQEVLDVIEWMREYNNLHKTDQISFYGCDIAIEDKRRNQELSVRDKAMANNCLKILNESDKDAKFALWSHNFHVSYLEELGNQGSFLRKKLGNGYYALRSLCNKGEFNAFLWDQQKEQTNGFKTFKLLEAQESTYEHMLAETKLPLAIFDVQKIKNQISSLPAQLSKYTIREVGSVYTPDNPKGFEHQEDLFNSCDGIMWVDTVTAATSLWK